MTERAMWTVPVDASPSSVHALAEALRRATDGSGPAVRPVPASGPPIPVPRETVPDEVAVVVATSGSSGEAKHVLLTAAALRASASATGRRLGGPGHWLLALPAEHVAGVQVVLRALLAGAAPVVQDLRSGFRPDGFARAAAQLPPGARHYTSLVPTQIARVLDTGPGAARDALASFDAVLVGGAALDPALRRRAEEAGVTVVATYGMSETCGGCVYDGVALDGVTVHIETPDAAGSGQIVLGGAVVAAGYLDPADDGGAFDGGRFRTGDLGRLDDGRLTVLGRADDMINTGGEKVAPGTVERALLGVPGVRAACATGLADDEWGQIVAALVVADPGVDDETLRSAVRSASGRAAVPRVLRRVDRIPERGIGKPDRAAATRLLSGEDPNTLRAR